jgi:hypothetical protein
LFCVLVSMHAAGGVAEEPPATKSPSLGGLFGGQKPRGAPVEPQLSEIAARLDELAKRVDAGSALDAIARGRRAHALAEGASRAGRTKLAERNKQIAWAALALASRRIAAASAQRARASAEQRANAAEVELANARRAFEVEAARLASLRAETR